MTRPHPGVNGVRRREWSVGFLAGRFRNAKAWLLAFRAIQRPRYVTRRQANASNRIALSTINTGAAAATPRFHRRPAA